MPAWKLEKRQEKQEIPAWIKRGFPFRLPDAGECSMRLRPGHGNFSPEAGLDQDNGHQQHSGDDAHDGNVMVSPAFRHGQQFVKGDEYHDACNGGEENREYGRCEEVEQEEHGDGCSHRFRQAGEEGITEGLFTAARTVVKRYRHGDSFRNVMDGYGQGDGGAQGQGVQSGGKSGDSFRKIVDADSQGEQNSGPFNSGGGKFTAGLSMDVFRAARFVRVFVFRNQIVNESRHGNSSEEGSNGNPGACRMAFELHQPVLGFSQQLHQGDIYHDSAG